MPGKLATTEEWRTRRRVESFSSCVFVSFVSSWPPAGDFGKLTLS
jgi:hypothetical protein